MKTLIGKRLIPFLVVFVGALPVIVGLFVAGKMSPREMGFVLAAVSVTAIVILTLLFDKAAKEAKSATHPLEARDDPAARKKIRRSIRTCKVAVVVMPLILVYALWATRNGPLLPRIVGAAINIAITSAFIFVLKAQKARLKR